MLTSVPSQINVIVDKTQEQVSKTIKNLEHTVAETPIKISQAIDTYLIKTLAIFFTVFFLVVLLSTWYMGKMAGHTLHQDLIKDYNHIYNIRPSNKI